MSSIDSQKEICELLNEKYGNEYFMPFNLDKIENSVQDEECPLDKGYAEEEESVTV